VGIALDPLNRIYVADFTTDSILVFSAAANGNVAPVAVLSGANTMLNVVGEIAVR
jgi:hypothetical protein